MTKTDIKHINVTLQKGYQDFEIDVVEGRAFSIQGFTNGYLHSPVSEAIIPDADGIALFEKHIERLDDYRNYLKEILEAMKEINGEQS